MIEYFTIIYCLIFGVCSQPACFDETMANNNYTVCRIDLAKSRLQLFLNDDAGNAYGSLWRLQNSVNERGKNLRFAMNGGMYSLTPLK